LTRAALSASIAVGSNRVWPRRGCGTALMHDHHVCPCNNIARWENTLPPS
jgi:hypothetical protein